MSEYSVYCECRNCRRVYLVYAEKGTPVPTFLTCPYCGVADLRKQNGQSGGYHAAMKWDGEKLVRQ